MENTIFNVWDVIATGDVFLQNKCGEDKPFSQGIEDLFRKSKISIINLETTIGNIGKPIEKAYNFRVSVDKAHYLANIGIDIVSIANNHTLDFGAEGFLNTIKILKANNIDFIGANIKGDNEFCIKELNEISIGFLAYYDSGDTLIHEINETNIQRDIINLKRKKVNSIIVSLHWGEEYVAFPTPKQQQLARKIIDFGADVIIGHHPHVVQGIEQYKNGMIFYSLGNFNFNVEHKYHDKLETTKCGFCVKLQFRNDHPCIRYEVVPIFINAFYQPCLFEENNGLRVIKYIDDLSVPLKKNISCVFWITHASKHYFRNHLPSFMRRIRKYGIRHFFQLLVWLVHPNNYKYYLGILLSLLTIRRNDFD